MAEEKEIVDFITKISAVETQLAVLGGEVKNGFSSIEGKLKVIFSGDSKKCVEQDAKIEAINIRVKSLEDCKQSDGNKKYTNILWFVQLVVAFGVVEFFKWILGKL